MLQLFQTSAQQLIHNMRIESGRHDRNPGIVREVGLLPLRDVPAHAMQNTPLAE